MKRIGIFGGTFNPPHLAHKRLALEMLEKAQLDTMLIIPTFVPPHKNANELASAEDRLEMCRRTFCEDCFKVSDIEIRREGKSYTYDTLCQLKEMYKDSKLFLVVGSDMLLSFHKWYRFDDILKMATLCAISREDGEGALMLSAYAKDVLGLNEIKGEIIISKANPIELSSTEIRLKIKAGEDVRTLIEEKTLCFIKEKELYL